MDGESNDESSSSSSSSCFSWPFRGDARFWPDHSEQTFVRGPPQLGILPHSPLGLQITEIVNRRDENGNTALMWAVLSRREDVAMELLDYGCALNVQNYVGESPLSCAVSQGFEPFVKLLLEKGANPNQPCSLENARPLHLAASTGHLNIMALLLLYGAYSSAQDDEGDTPLHWAVRNGNVEATRLLLTSGANPCLVNEDGESSLELAENLGETALLQLFLEYLVHQHRCTLN